MRVARNLTVGFGATLWSALIGLAVVPVYLHYLGVEAYGLVGFYLAMQAAFQVLDLGLGPTISREVARAEVAGSLPAVRDLLRTLGLFYWGMAGLIALAVGLGASWIGTEWLQGRALAPETIVGAVALIGANIALRFPTSLYTGVVIGAHRLAEVSIINALASTVAAIGAVLVLGFVSPTIEAFFVWQLLVVAVVVVAMRSAAWRVLGGAGGARFDWSTLRGVWRFSAGMGAVTLVSIILSQLDKLVLSRAVSLEDLGLYTLAGFAARLLAMLVAPVFNTVYPRLTALLAAGDSDGVIATYTIGTRLLLTVMMPLALFLSVFAAEVFTLWTGNAAISTTIVPVVQLLLLGNVMNSVMVFPYALQLASGQSRLAALIAAILLVGFVSLLLWLVPIWGIVGAAAAWAALNIAYVPFGTLLTHRMMLPGVGRRWLMADVGIPSLLALVIVGGGGLVVQNAGLPLLVELTLGAGLVGAAFATTIAVTPSLLAGARRWRTWHLALGTDTGGHPAALARPEAT